jgi:hypothetical protein
VNWADFINDFCGEFGHLPAPDGEMLRRLMVLFDNGESAMLTAAIWARNLDIDLARLEPWIASWFFRRDGIRIQEQQIIYGV